MIKREMYLERIRPFYEASMIKVITGVRRAGKSVLLRQIAEEIKEQLGGADGLITVDFDDYANQHLLDPDELYHYIAREIESMDAKRAYLFFDEIQNVPDFEVVVNSLNNLENVSIFLTGSNSRLLSGEMATKLGGRTVSFRMMPFSFRECVSFEQEREGELSTEQVKALLDRYLRWGGFPLVCAQRDDESRLVVLENLYSSIVLRDIIQRNRSVSPTTLENVLDFLIANSSNTVSGNSIAAALCDANRKVSAPTVYDLIKAIEDSYIVSKAQRFDVRGKKLLAFEAKEYVCDLGLFRLRKNRVKDEWSSIIETVVYNELLARDLHVYVGKAQRGEIDFIVQKGEKRCYIQACYLIASDEVREREFGAFEGVADSYPRYVISMDPVTRNQDGVTHLELLDFLMKPDLLRLG